MSPASIPVTLITGFLGAGKTTLLNHLGAAGGLTDTLVVINEFGQVGLDHLLMIEQKTNSSLSSVMDASAAPCMATSPALFSIGWIKGT